MYRNGDGGWGHGLEHDIKCPSSNTLALEFLLMIFRDTGLPPGDLEGIRERLFNVMWEDAGIVREGSGLDRAASALTEVEDELNETGVAGEDPAYNMTWHDWLNLKSQIRIGRAITAAAAQRQDSRGAHFRSDFPEMGELARSSYTRVRLEDGALALETRPVNFTRVAPGQSLIE